MNSALASGEMRRALRRYRALRQCRALRRCRALGTVLLLWALIATPAGARVEFSQLSAALGWGYGGLFHQEHFGDAMQSTKVGRFSSNAYWFDIGYLFKSEVTAGVRVHHLRAALDEGGDVGDFDILPVTIFAGYRHSVLTSRLRGFATIGAGVGAARFLESGEVDLWQRPGGGPVGVSHEHPFVFEVTAGADVAISEELSLELALGSVFMDSQVAYEPAASAAKGGFVPQHTYEVDARHLLFMAGVRWWVEWW